MRSVPQNLQEMAEGVVSSLGYELVGVELMPKPKVGHLLRIYIDAENGVGVEHCAAVSRQLGAVLDVEEPIRGDYSLEVSSPGVDRPLFTAEQFARYVGSNVRIKLNVAVAGRKNYKGKLLNTNGNDLQVMVDNETYDISLDQVDTARLVPVF